MTATLSEAVEQLNYTADLLLSPCGFGCNCLTGDHLGKASSLNGSLDGYETSPAAAAGQLRQAANLIATNGGSALQQVKGFAEHVEAAYLSAQRLALETEYRMLVHHIAGDLPKVIAKQGRPRRQGSFQVNAGTFVYVAHDGDDKVIYVGITDDLFGRMSQHRRMSRWWNRMVRMDWEEWPDRDAALRKERILIRRYRPPFNVINNPDAKGAK
jgi:predicted GIY-YIG superfamily endonuclease